MLKKFGKYVLFAILLVVVVGIGWGIRCAWMAMDAEYTLQAYRTTIEAIHEHMLFHEGRWPESWNDLGKTQTAQDRSGWFEMAPERVTIDFTVKTQEVAEMTPEVFRDRVVVQREPFFIDTNRAELTIELAKRWNHE